MYDTFSIVNFDFVQKPIHDRACDGCTSCCEGWLTANIYGIDMYPGKPCRFADKSNGCTIYNNRPANPCKGFYCYWKGNKDVPEHFKPSISKNILVLRSTEDGARFLDINEAGKPVDFEILNWAIEQYRSKKVDSVRWIMGANKKMNYVSRDQRFINKMNQLLQEDTTL